MASSKSSQFLSDVQQARFRSSTGTGKRKKRDVSRNVLADGDDGEQQHYEYPFLEEIVRLRYARMELPQCQKKIFCRMANYGRRGGEEEEQEEDGANRVQRSMRYLARL